MATNCQKFGGRLLGPAQDRACRGIVLANAERAERPQNVGRGAANVWHRAIRINSRRNRKVRAITRRPAKTRRPPRTPSLAKRDFTSGEQLFGERPPRQRLNDVRITGLGRRVRVRGSAAESDAMPGVALPFFPAIPLRCTACTSQLG